MTGSIFEGEKRINNINNNETAEKYRKRLYLSVNDELGLQFSHLAAAAVSGFTYIQNRQPATHGIARDMAKNTVDLAKRRKW